VTLRSSLSGTADPSPIQIATELIRGEEEEVPSMSQLRRLAAQVLVVTIPVLLVVVETPSAPATA
jgi:hypothetical protein